MTKEKILLEIVQLGRKGIWIYKNLSMNSTKEELFFELELLRKEQKKQNLGLAPTGGPKYRKLWMN